MRGRRVTKSFFPRSAELRFGLFMDTDTIGWAVVEMNDGATRRRVDGERFGVDPVQGAVELWLDQPSPRAPVALYRFNNEDDFSGSRAHREGLSLDQHRLILVRTAAALRGAGADVVFVRARS